MMKFNGTPTPTKSKSSKPGRRAKPAPVNADILGKKGKK
jgi:hypothetical protein